MGRAVVGAQRARRHARLATSEPDRRLLRELPAAATRGTRAVDHDGDPPLMAPARKKGALPARRAPRNRVRVRIALGALWREARLRGCAHFATPANILPRMASVVTPSQIGRDTLALEPGTEIEHHAV